LTHEMDANWLEIANRQHEVITPAQLSEAGLSLRKQRTLVAAGVLLRVERNVLVLASASDTWTHRVWRGILGAGQEAFVHRASAARLWDLDGMRHYHGVDIAVPAHRRPRPPVTRIAALCAGDVTNLDGLPLSTVSRTLLDLGEAATTDQVEMALECALRRGEVSVPQMVHAVADRRSTGARVLRQVLARRAAGAPPTESQAETVFVQLVRDLGLPDPVRQHQVVVGGRTYRLDFAWPDLWLAVEVDGASTHGPERFVSDLVRQNHIVLGGRTILRFAASSVGRADPLVHENLLRAWKLQSTTQILRAARAAGLQRPRLVAGGFGSRPVRNSP
jgi:very-short-patch-repair endonuclease